MLMNNSMFGTLQVAMILTVVGFFAPGVKAVTHTLTNGQVSVSWNTQGSQLLPPIVTDLKSDEKLELKGDLFTLVLTNGGFIHASDFSMKGGARIEPLPVDSAASRFAERLPGHSFVAELVSRDGKIQATWRGILREGSRYLRQQLTIKAVGADIPLKGIVMLETPFPNAKSTGTVEGSPVTTETVYFGVEHPLSVNRGEMGFVRCFLPRGEAIRKGESFDCTLLTGFVDRGQLRRGFLLGYLERERAHPYRPFLHYNSWYDIG